jgi:hypothetical protein
MPLLPGQLYLKLSVTCDTNLLWDPIQVILTHQDEENLNAIDNEVAQKLVFYPILILRRCLLLKMTPKDTIVYTELESKLSRSTS